MKYVSADCLGKALDRLHGQAGHMLKIWLVLKWMGLREGSDPVEVDTRNSTEALTNLFGFGDPEGKFFIPFAHTPRYATMKPDASRSIIQSTVQRWASSGSVVTCDPSSYLDFSSDDDGLTVSCGRSYPLGLGHGESGFARRDEVRVSLPITSFAIWYGRHTAIPADADPGDFLLKRMISELHISPVESSLIFVDDSIEVDTSDVPLTDEVIFAACSRFLTGDIGSLLALDREREESFEHYSRRVRSMSPQVGKPAWLRSRPSADLEKLIESQHRAILIYGPPRTGKSRIIDGLIPRSSPDRVTIQLHEGWSYDYLIEGYRPDDDGEWAWREGALATAIRSRKKFIVLEEVNRTSLSQSLGEVFSVLEDAYRGEQNAVILRSGEMLFIAEETTILMTMNNVDKSTEEIDDALLGRVSALEFPPDPEALIAILEDRNVAGEVAAMVVEAFAAILSIYPIGHGYFASIPHGASVDDCLFHLRTRVFPVIGNFLGQLRIDEMTILENSIGEIFGVN
jgi:5-methylcytosine-specific restriction protein B